jgi:plasmid stabilization system protein ParE
LKVTFAAEARQEFAEAARWYAVEAGGFRAADFNNTVKRTVNLLVAHPAMGTPSPHNTRRIVVHRYPYAIVYRADVDTVRILAVAHQHRRPGYWVGRR